MLNTLMKIKMFYLIHQFTWKVKENDITVEVSLQYTDSYRSNLLTFTNNIHILMKVELMRPDLR